MPFAYFGKQIRKFSCHDICAKNADDSCDACSDELTGTDGRRSGIWSVDAASAQNVDMGVNETRCQNEARGVNDA